MLSWVRLLRGLCLSSLDIVLDKAGVLLGLGGSASKDSGADWTAGSSSMSWSSPSAEPSSSISIGSSSVCVRDIEVGVQGVCVRRVGEAEFMESGYG